MTDGSSPARYPGEREADVVLRDGSTIHVRPVRADDEAGIRAFLNEVSAESIGFRFFGAADLNWVTAWSLDVDYVDRFALVAETGDPARIVAHAAYIRINKERAEVAFLVADAWQGRGISTIALAHLATIGAENGITTFVAEVLPANHRMIEVFRQSGFPIDSRSTQDAIEIEFPTSLSPAALERFEERERVAAVAAVKRFLEPRSVAVVGASRRRGTIGGEILHNLTSNGFTGTVYAVNKSADVVQSLPAYRSVGEIPGDLDLAVVIVPAADVLDIARQCAATGVKGLLVISAGFAETGAEGAQRERRLLDVCRQSGMRLIGPNCLGVLSTAPATGLNATFAAHPAAAGRIAFLSQSGGVGIAIMKAADRLGIGLSSFVSVGNKADLSGNDFLEYWEQDPGTDVALLYLESFGNPRKFARVARRFAERKPLLAVTSRRSAAGAPASSSHTGALLSAADVTVDALFHQAGVIRADTLHEMLDVAALLAKQPVPGGDRVAIVTNGGGPGIMCADACQAAGAQVPDTGAGLRAELAQLVPKAVSVSNPVELRASASAGDYGHALRALAESGDFDAVVCVFVPALTTGATDVARAVSDAAQTARECVIAAVFMTGEGPPPELQAGRVRVPGYRFPEEAARATGLAARHGAWRAQPRGVVRRPSGGRPDEAAAIISEQLALGDEWMGPATVSRLLACYGLALVAGEPLPDAGGAAAAAVKQTMAPDGVQLIVGVVHDQSFGPVLACGAAGTAAELVNDVAVRITPITDLDARDMVRSLKTFPLLDGYRGAVRCDIAAIEEVLMSVSAMVEAHPAIAALDLNPLIAGPQGVAIVDARLRVKPSAAPPPLPSVGA